MIRFSMAVVALLSHLAFAQTPSTRPSGHGGRGSRVLIISIDGLRPDLALRADMPNLRGLLKAGAYTFWAQTTDIALTLPSHASMLTGVTPNRHGITWNDDGPDETVSYPDRPTLFGLARKAGYTTAFVGAKSKLAPLAEPGTLNWSDLPDPGKRQRRNDDVATRAADLIAKRKPQVMVVHLGDVDRAGHAAGWGTPEQIEAIESADRAIGKVLAALRAIGEDDDTLVIVTADHGGYERTHGKADPRSAFIPWIAVGPGVRAGFDLTRLKRTLVRTEDTFATACYFLSITIGAEVDGKYVASAFDQNELIEPIKSSGKPSP